MAKKGFLNQIPHTDRYNPKDTFMKMQNRFEMKGKNFVHSVLNYTDIIFELVMMMKGLVKY